MSFKRIVHGLGGGAASAGSSAGTQNSSMSLCHTASQTKIVSCGISVIEYVHRCALSRVFADHNSEERDAVTQRAMRCMRCSSLADDDTWQWPTLRQLARTIAEYADIAAATTQASRNRTCVEPSRIVAHHLNQQRVRIKKNGHDKHTTQEQQTPPRTCGRTVVRMVEAPKRACG